MPLNILDFEDAEERAVDRMERLFAEIVTRFNQPLIDTEMGVRAVNAAGPDNPEAARKIKIALGGDGD